MKINLTLICVFTSFIIYAYSGLFEQDRIGATQLNGNGCVCHNLNESPEVKVWIEGPDTLIAGQTGIYKMFLADGPAEAGGYNVAGRFGVMGLLDTLSVWDYREPGELTQAFPLVFPTPDDTIFWEFAYTADDSSDTDTLYSCGLSIVYDAQPDSLDLWAFGPKFPLTIIDDPTPVELVSFNIYSDEKGNRLRWITATEINNKGFEIQKAESELSFLQGEFSVLGFVDGMGTSTIQKEYEFIDTKSGSTNFYRLKQIDFDGTYSYSSIVSATGNTSVNDFSLNQNYPNPFNPSTKIGFTIKEDSDVSLTVYDINGEKVSDIFKGRIKHGYHEFEFNTKNISSGISAKGSYASGVYYYSLESSGKRIVKKMLLLK